MDNFRLALCLGSYLFLFFNGHQDRVSAKRYSIWASGCPSSTLALKNNGTDKDKSRTSVGKTPTERNICDTHPTQRFQKTSYTTF